MGSTSANLQTPENSFGHLVVCSETTKMFLYCSIVQPQTSITVSSHMALCVCFRFISCVPEQITCLYFRRYNVLVDPKPCVGAENRPQTAKTLLSHAQVILMFQCDVNREKRYLKIFKNIILTVSFTLSLP